MQSSPVLYAEDEPDDVVFMEFAFKKAGVANPLVAVKDGQQAIDYLAGAGAFVDRDTHPLPCLLLLDLNLPRKSGFEVLKWIQERGPASVKVIVLTSSVKPQDVELTKKLGAVDCLAKAKSISLLIECVTQIKAQWLD